MFYNVAVAAMTILAVWAAFWAGFSFTRFNVKDKAKKAFWRMSLYWSGINLFVAGLGLVQAQTKKDAYKASLSTQSTQIVFVGVNILLDLLYICVAIFLMRRKSKKPTVSYGYGKAILVQGIFLLIFDILLVMTLDSVRI